MLAKPTPPHLRTTIHWKLGLLAYEFLKDIVYDKKKKVVSTLSETGLLSGTSITQY